VGDGGPVVLGLRDERGSKLTPLEALQRELGKVIGKGDQEGDWLFVLSRGYSAVENSNKSSYRLTSGLNADVGY
jgi:hypothetical protein